MTAASINPFLLFQANSYTSQELDNSRVRFWRDGKHISLDDVAHRHDTNLEILSRPASPLIAAEAVILKKQGIDRTISWEEVQKCKRTCRHFLDGTAQYRVFVNGTLDELLKVTANGALR